MVHLGPGASTSLPRTAPTSPGPQDRLPPPSRSPGGGLPIPVAGRRVPHGYPGQQQPASGSHNGVQAWAFDFGLPAGTQIRAARDGVVEWIQNNVNRNFDPSPGAAGNAGNVPFPPGDLGNWGNTARIRHLGGLTSWYFHIQQNSFLVNVGDVVTQGQAIALSGNTGRSSAPHLHFQYRPTRPTGDSQCRTRSVPTATSPPARHLGDLRQRGVSSASYIDLLGRSRATATSSARSRPARRTTSRRSPRRPSR